MKTASQSELSDTAPVYAGGSGMVGLSRVSGEAIRYGT